MPPTILITGAAGFVGGHVTREARRLRVRLRLVRHHRTPLAPTADVVRADLVDPGSLRGICDGVDVLVHCAARIGGDTETNEAVNARGTAALVAEARRAGVRRVVQLSTASVYGRGTFRGSRPEDLVRNPASVTSRTRAAAEDAVLGAGGIVLRPHLVYGAGDAWVGPGLARILRALPGTVDGWPARTSMIAVTDLARLLVAAALAPDGGLTRSVYHAAHPEPVAVSALLRAVAECGSIAWPRTRIGAERARAVLAEHGQPPSALDMLTTDHVFDSGPLWSDLRQSPGAPFPAGFRREADWYREALRAG
ncbi:NAD(P)-dependent oxidoreductase [Streptomyces sp. NRRL S-31]|uniref:NAD-dependent epimerase/dehydratase family protein n=1 Tax=Streptomyces sp. NRRL S-31 TaxID=1463898 RepID=UPI0004CA7426|nr:NAD-dependent epimerase/dehydratase family protein [Streptomyces sp. NRRL S-31]